MPQHCSKTVSRLLVRQHDLDQDLYRSSETYGSFTEYYDQAAGPDSDFSVVDEFISDLGVDAVKTMTNFTHQGFLTLWAQVEQVLHPAWTLGRGRR